MGRRPASRSFVLAQVAGVIAADRLEVDFVRRDLGKGGLGQDCFGHVLDRLVHDLVNERDVSILTRGDAGDDLASGDFGIDDRFAATPPSITTKYCMEWPYRGPSESGS